MCLNCRPIKITNALSAAPTSGAATLRDASELLDDLDMSYDVIDLISVAEYLTRNTKENNA